MMMMMMMLIQVFTFLASHKIWNGKRLNCVASLMSQIVIFIVIIIIVIIIIIKTIVIIMMMMISEYLSQQLSKRVMVSQFPIRRETEREDSRKNFHAIIGLIISSKQTDRCNLHFFSIHHHHHHHHHHHNLCCFSEIHFAD